MRADVLLSWLNRGTALSLLLVAAVGHAQPATVVFDGSLGDTPGPAPNPSGVEYLVDYCPSCSESHGLLVGSNLFQSFERFDVGAGDAVTFRVSEPAGPAIDTVISRVTGADPSEIFGQLNSEIEGADFYLLNPYGVVFGEDAKIDTMGSFFVSTADELRFEGLDTGFVARPDGSVPITSSPPSAFGFWIDSVADNRPAAIRFDGSQLAMEPGESFTAVAGRVKVVGRGDTVDLPSVQVTGGDIQLAAASAGVEVPVQVTGMDVSMAGPLSAAVTLTNNAILAASNAASASGGRIVIRGGRFEMIEGDRHGQSGRISVDSGSSAATPDRAVDIEVVGDVSVGRGFVEALTDTAKGGDITIKAGSVDLHHGTSVVAASRGSGPGGSIEIVARDVVVSSESSLATRSTSVGGGDAGAVVIAAEDAVEIVHSSISTFAADAGGGRISMQGGQLVYLLDSVVGTTVRGLDYVTREGDGDIDIPLRGDEVSGLEPVPPEFFVMNRSRLFADAIAVDGGNIIIRADNGVYSSDSTIEATSALGQDFLEDPAANLVGNLHQLPGHIIDASSLLFPPCVARNRESGTFVVEAHPAVSSPDAPLSPSLIGGSSNESDASAANGTRCASPVK